MPAQLALQPNRHDDPQASSTGQGGAGIDDYRFDAIVNEEFGRSGFAGAGLDIALPNDVVGPYLLDVTTREQ